MRSPPLALVLVLAAGLLGGCRTGRIVDAPPTGTPLVNAEVPSPTPDRPSEFVPCAADYSSGCYTTCRPVGPRTSPIGEVYAGVQAVAFPAWGGAVEFGQVFTRSRLATWSFEGDVNWQNLSSEIGGTADSGDFAQVRGGIKASLLPCGRGHPTVRAGIGWFRTTERTDWIGNAGDYFAFHAGIGYEFDVTRRFTTGPEITAILAAEEKGFDLKFAPQVRWHFIWKF